MSNNENIFVTGATGFIGGHLCRVLQQRGYGVSALVRASPGGPIVPGVRTVVGAVEQPDTYRWALSGQHAVIHLAAMYRLGPVDRRAMYTTNVDGTRALIDTACAAGVGRVIHVSSTAALGETGGRELTEEHRHNGVFRSFYEQTKHIAHGIAEARIRAGMPVITAIPGGVFGRGDTSALAQALRDFVRGKLPFQVATESRFNLCGVAALCDGLVRVLEHSPLGESWILCGENLSMSELLGRAAQLTGTKAPPALPRWVLSMPARLLDAVAGFLPMEVPLSREALAVMDNSTYTYSSQKAHTRLGWHAGDVSAHLATYLAELANEWP